MRAKDSKLVDMLIEGRKSAFEQLYNSYSNRVFNLSFFLLKDTGWSEDTVQEVFLKLWENRTGLQSDQNLWHYLYVLTKRHALNRLRSIKRSNACFDRLWARFSEPSENPDDAIAAKELRDSINLLLESLPTQQRTAFSLSRLEGFSHLEIAEHLNISPNTVKNHIVRAVKHLKNHRLLHCPFMSAVFSSS